MSVLKGVLFEEKERLELIIFEYQKKIDNLPKGSIFIRKMRNSFFVYRRHRSGNQIISEYIGSVDNDISKKAISDYEEIKRLKENMREAKSEYKKLCKAVKAYEWVWKSFEWDVITKFKSPIYELKTNQNN